MFVIDPKKLKKLTLWLVGLITTGTLSLQIDWVNAHLQPLISAHPHLSTIGTGLVMILTVLHNPKAQTIISEFFSEEEIANGAATKTTQVTVAKTDDSQ